jgi:hypothetical protein
MLRLVMAVAACTAIRCGSGFAAPESQAFSDAFAGTWRSVTPSREFVRLSVFSSSSESCALAARLTFSGVAWDGGGRIVGDSLVLRMSTAGSAAPTATVVLHSSDGQTVRVQLRPENGATLDLTFVRDDN